MNRKLITRTTLFLTICFLLLGIIFKILADEQQAMSVSTGIILDGQFSEISSGRIGEDREKYESLNTGGTIFYILAGVTGIICIVSAVGKKKDK